MKVDADHYRQLTDEHQPVVGDVAEEADRFVGDGVEHSEEVRQLMPFDPAVGKHAQFAMQGSATEPRLCFGTRPQAGTLSPLPVCRSLSRRHLTADQLQVLLRR